MAEGKFKVIKVTPLESLTMGAEIPESDVTFQTEDQLIQLEHVEQDSDKKKTIIKPGVWNLEDGSFGVDLQKYNLREYQLIPEIDNTSKIVSEYKKLFGKLEKYKKYCKKNEVKRSILIASPAGVGKTAAITEVCKTALEDHKGTCVINWNTSDVRSGSVNRFFLHRSKFRKDVNRLILIIEDIGGGTLEEYGGHKTADSALLNFLDGTGDALHGVPTFIVATTNNPEQIVAPLIDRPGRFDKVLHLQTPSQPECLALLKFYLDKELDENDEKAAEVAAKNKFSIAHVEEIVRRHILDEITTLEAAKELEKHKKRFKEQFQDNANSIGIRPWD